MNENTAAKTPTGATLPPLADSAQRPTLLVGLHRQQQNVSAIVDEDFRVFFTCVSAVAVKKLRRRENLFVWSLSLSSRPCSLFSSPSMAGWQKAAKAEHLFVSSSLL